MPPALETPLRAVLFVSSNHEDRASLERSVNFNWTVIASATVASAISVLEERPLPIVICDSEIASGTWGELLERISLFPDPPLLIVTSRLADERLWAEAINLGAWDVLAQPFDAEEAIRIVGFAWQHWRDRHNVLISRAQEGRLASRTGQMAATGT
jgi:DNA-binding NtrC family response regulator